jgi:hypothetical protein
LETEVLVSKKRAFKRKHKNRAVSPLAKFEEKLGKTELPGDTKLVIRRGGKEKMSEVLAEFIEPYVEHADSDDAYRRLLVIAIVAWNTALLPEERQQLAINDFLEGLDLGFFERLEFISFIKTMMERKKTYFPDNKRFIINFELTDLGDSMHLSVASTPE